MSRIIIVTILFLAVIFKYTVAVGHMPSENKVEITEIKKTDGTETKPIVYEIKNDLNNNKTGNDVKTSNVTAPILPVVKDDEKQSQNQTNKDKKITIITPNNPNNLPALNEPALHRLFYVLLGLSTVTVCYVAMKMYRVRKGVTRPTHVRKYGVLAQRSDIEMEPLHLDDDEDDDTVFDVGVHANR